MTGPTDAPAAEAPVSDAPVLDAPFLDAPAAGRGPIARVLLAVIGFYRMAVSPALAPACRYQPSCSAYAVEAIEVHGAARGSWLALRRLLRCHPFHAGGHDPVPPRVGSETPKSTVATQPARPGEQARVAGPARVASSTRVGHSTQSAA